MKEFLLRLTPQMFERIKEISQVNKRSINQEINNILDIFLMNVDKEGKQK